MQVWPLPVHPFPGWSFLCFTLNFVSLPLPVWPDLCWLDFAGSAFDHPAFALSALPVPPVSVRHCLLRGVFIRIEKAFFLCYVVAMYQVAKLQCLDYRHCTLKSRVNESF